MLKLNSKMFEESKKSTASENLIVNIIVFIVVFIAISIAESIIPTILSNGEMKTALELSGIDITDFSSENIDKMMAISSEISMMPKYFVPTLVCTVFGTLISMFHCRIVEARHLRSMGMRKGNIVKHYLQGLLVGTVLMTAIVLISVITGISGMSLCSGINFGLIVLYLVGFFFQGMSEEFIFRGYLMTTVGGKHHPYIAVLVSAAGFSLAHAFNPGFGPLVFVNLAMFGAFAALYMICFGDIWGVCAIHSIWNFTQGNLYGISVSGSGETESVFRTTAKSSSVLLTGGEFGIEGSIVTTIVLGVAIAAVVVKMSKKKEDAAEVVEEKKAE